MLLHKSKQFSEQVSGEILWKRDGKRSAHVTVIAIRASSSHSECQMAEYILAFYE